MAARDFKVSRDDDGVYHFQGELSIHGLDELRAILDRALENGQEMAISLAKVTFVDTAALQLLIAFKRRLEPEAALRISAVSAEVDDILSLCGLKTALL